jgi:hypothetical protein
MSTGAGAIFGNPMNSLQDWNRPPSSGGSNQWMQNYPALPNFNPSVSTGGSSTPWAMTSPSAAAPTGTTPGGDPYIGHGLYENPTYDPGFTGGYYGMLQQLMAGGGGDLQNQLLSFLSGGSSTIPGASSLTEMAKTGDPISALPEWQKMIAAQQQNIQQNQAQLKEQFGFAGDLQSSPFGTAMSNYEQQTSKDQDALLAQLEQQSMESAMQRKLAASQDITGMAGAETQFLDQLFSQGAFASPGLSKKSSSSPLGGIGSLLSSLFGAAGQAGSFGALFGAGGAAAGAGAAEGAGMGAAELASLLAI